MKGKTCGKMVRAAVLSAALLAGALPLSARAASVEADPTIRVGLYYGSNALAVASMRTAVGKMTMPFQNAFFMGVLCNILVTLGVLFSLSAKDVAGRILGAYTPVAFFVICGFNHSIADMFYCTVGLFSRAQYAAQAAEAGIAVESLTWGNYFLGNMLPVTLGNIVGGICVGFLFWFCWLRGSKKKG